MTSKLISKHALDVIEQTISNYPKDRKQSAVLTALMEVQHENGGYLTEALMDEVAPVSYTHLTLPPIYSV